MTVQLDGFGLVGYRSFCTTPAYLYPLRRLNLLVGKNNSGKSNILRFLTLHLSTLVGNLRNSSGFALTNAIDKPLMPGSANVTQLGFSLGMARDSQFFERWSKSLRDQLMRGGGENV